MISIDRQATRFAVFDGMAGLHRDFENYTAEDEAIAIGRKFIADRTAPGSAPVNVKIVYPEIKHLKKSTK